MDRGVKPIVHYMFKGGHGNEWFVLKIQKTVFNQFVEGGAELLSYCCEEDLDEVGLADAVHSR